MGCYLNSKLELISKSLTKAQHCRNFGKSVRCLLCQQVTKENCDDVIIRRNEGHEGIVNEQKYLLIRGTRIINKTPSNPPILQSVWLPPRRKYYYRIPNANANQRESEELSLGISPSTPLLFTSSSGVCAMHSINFYFRYLSTDVMVVHPAKLFFFLFTSYFILVPLIVLRWSLLTKKCHIVWNRSTSMITYFILIVGCLSI